MANSHKPLVSLGIPTYNRSHLLSPTLDSILSQNYENIEIIISDNGSNDGTAKFLKSYTGSDARIKYFRHPQNKGPYFNYDACRRLAMGRYFMWVDPGAELLPKVLETYVSFLEANQDYVTVSGKINHLEKGNLIYTEEGFSLEDDNPFRRVQFFYSQVQQGTLLYGLHRNVWIRQNPIRRNLVGDWHFIAANAFMGKVKSLNMVGSQRVIVNDSCGEAYLTDLIERLGLAKYWIRFPKLRVALETFEATTSYFPVFYAIPIPKRGIFALQNALCIGLGKKVEFGAIRLDLPDLSRLFDTRNRKEIRSKSV